MEVPYLELLFSNRGDCLYKEFEFDYLAIVDLLSLKQIYSCSVIRISYYTST